MPTCYCAKTIDILSSIEVIFLWLMLLWLYRCVYMRVCAHSFHHSPRIPFHVAHELYAVLLFHVFKHQDAPNMMSFDLELLTKCEVDLL